MTEGSKIKVTNIQWIIEVKRKLPFKNTSYVSDLDRLVSIISKVEATPWLIIFDKIPERVRREAKSQSIMLTGIDEWEKLKASIESN